MEMVMIVRACDLDLGVCGGSHRLMWCTDNTTYKRACTPLKPQGLPTPPPYGTAARTPHTGARGGMYGVRKPQNNCEQTAFAPKRKRVNPVSVTTYRVNPVRVNPIRVLSANKFNVS